MRCWGRLFPPRDKSRHVLFARPIRSVSSMIIGDARRAGPLSVIVRWRRASSFEGCIMFWTRIVLGSTTVFAAFGALSGLAKIERRHALLFVILIGGAFLPVSNVHAQVDCWLTDPGGSAVRETEDRPGLRRRREPKPDDRNRSEKDVSDHRWIWVYPDRRQCQAHRPHERHQPRRLAVRSCSPPMARASASATCGCRSGPPI